MNRISLWPAPVEGDFQPYLTPYPLEGDALRPAVIVCPGGGYCCRAPHEGEPISRRFNELGFHAFTLEYRVAPSRYPAPQLDALRAIKLVRSRASEFHIDPAKVVILGFSAGGHLACSTGFLYEELDAQCAAGDAADAVSGRPDAAVLCYAVISGIDHEHYGSMQTLLGQNDIPCAERRRLSGELRVTADTPPAFLWHTAADDVVPVENSLNYAAALRRFNIPFGLSIYPFGGHGLGLGKEYPDVRRWPQAAADFLCAIWKDF